MKKCPNCGRAYSDMIKVCPECNVSLDGNSGNNSNSAPVYTSQPQQHTSQAPQPQQVSQPPMPQPQVQIPQYQQPAQVPSQPAAKKDSGSFLWGIPGFLIPLLGVILYFCWHKSKPKTAAVALKGAGIGFFVNMALRFIPL